MLENFKIQVVKILSRIQIRMQEDVDAMEAKRREQAAEAEKKFKEEAEAKSKEAKANQTFIREGVKVGRNDPCPCGSGKKYKKCCMIKRLKRD